MKKAFHGLISVMTFFNNYKAVGIGSVLLIFSICLHAQVNPYDSTKIRQVQSAYGFEWKNGAFDGPLVLGKGIPNMSYKDSGAITYYQGKVYLFNGTAWVAINSGSSSDATKRDKADTILATGTATIFSVRKDYNGKTNNYNNTKEIYYHNGIAVDSISIKPLVFDNYLIVNATGDTVRTAIRPGVNFAIVDSVGVDGITYKVFRSTGGTYTAGSGLVLQGTQFKIQDTINGAGNKFIWMPSKGAFRAGTLNAGSPNNWDVDSIGLYSTATGYNTKAKAIGSTAIGYYATANGQTSVAIGSITTANGIGSFSGGLQSSANGYSSTAFGYLNKANGYSSTVMGEQSNAIATNSLALGKGIKTRSYRGVAIGSYNDISGTYDSINFNSANKAFEVGIGDSSTREKNGLEVLFSGKTRLNQYGAGLFTGTPAYGLQVDASGNIIEGSVSGGGITVETDPIVRAINGIVKSNGTTISAAIGSDIPNITESQVINLLSDLVSKRNITNYTFASNILVNGLTFGTGLSATGTMGGLSAGQNDAGNYAAGWGYAALQNNTGYSPSAVGIHALQWNAGNYSTSFGANSGQFNNADYATLGGNNSGNKNTGLYASLYGAQSSPENNWNNRTSIGSYTGQFVPNAATAKTFTNTNINPGTQQITITSHGFGAAGTKVNLQYNTVSGTAPTGYVTGFYYLFTIVDANTLSSADVTTAGSGTFTLTKDIDRSGAIELGYGATAQKAYQAIIGNSSITETKVLGGLMVDSFAHRVLVFGGDSYSTSVLHWPSFIGDSSAYFGQAMQKFFSVAGRTVSTMIANYSTEVHTARPLLHGDDYWFFSYAGVNNISFSYTADSTYKELKTYWALAKQDSFRVVAFTVIKSLYFNTAKNNAVDSLNKMILSDPSLYDHVVDVASVFDPNIDRSVFIDSTHLTTTGYRMFAGFVANSITKRVPYILTTATPISATYPASASPTRYNMLMKMPVSFYPGTTTYAPILIPKGILTTTPKDGSVEYDGVHYYGSIGVTRYQLDQQTGGVTFPALANKYLTGFSNTFATLQADSITNGTVNQFVTSGAQLFAGSKQFSTSPILNSITKGSILFAGTGGQILQNNAKFYFDSANIRLGIGMNAPQVPLAIQQASATTNAALGMFSLIGRTTGTAANGFGTAFSTFLQSSTTYDQPAAFESTYWIDATDASRRAGKNSFLYNTSGAGKLGITQQLQPDQATVFNGAGVVTPTSVLHTTSFATGYVAKTGAYTAASTDDIIECTSGTFTLTLPTAIGCTGREYWFTNSGSGIITAGTTSSQLFMNVVSTPTTITIAQFTNYRFVSNGTNWLAFKIVN